jgi:ring-1,2-phenylacetyl-CoA epoxidase subunit PaaD
VTIAAVLSAERAWDALRAVPDPEIPVISVVDLGIVRSVAIDGDAVAPRVTVWLTPTYSGCPATEAIERAIVASLHAAGAAEVRVSTQLAPAWTTDWIAPAARERLRAYGIAPPGARASAADGADEQPIRFAPPAALDCPRCGSRDTERLSQFGATACKALYRCRACREPFEYFKPL